MQWLFDQAEQYRARIRDGVFFARLARRDNKQAAHAWLELWSRQLLHQSREFTQALCLRYSLCHDQSYQGIFAEHALEEAEHPDQLAGWISDVGIGNEEVRATRETIDSLAYCWRSALRDPHDLQVVVLNLMSEGVALDFYSAVVPHLEWLGVHSGAYWDCHRKGDVRHMALGLDRLHRVGPDQPTGVGYRLALAHSAALHHAMLTSWARIDGYPDGP